MRDCASDKRVCGGNVVHLLPHTSLSLAWSHGNFGQRESNAWGVLSLATGTIFHFALMTTDSAVCAEVGVEGYSSGHAGSMPRPSESEQQCRSADDGLP